MERFVECPNCGSTKTIHSSNVQWKCPDCDAWIKVENTARPIRATYNCCIDCISCIMANIPMEAGIAYTCINPKGRQHYVSQWDTACIHFIGG